MPGVTWDTATDATALAFVFFCLTICTFTDHHDSSTCEALGNRSFTLGSYIFWAGGRKAYILHSHKRAVVHNGWQMMG